MKLTTILFAGAAMFAATGASAQTYTESLDLPGFRSSGPRVLQNNSPFTSGVKLTGANQVSNPSDWHNGFDVSLDTIAKTITLTGDGENDYQTINFDLTGISGFRFTGLTAIDPYGATSEDDGPYSYSTSFTDSSLHIGYSVDDIKSGTDFFINQGSSVFSYTTAATGAVPEPASWAMMILGMGAVGYAMRRRKAVTTRVQFA